MNALDSLFSGLRAVNVKSLDEMRFGDDAIRKIQAEAKKINSWLSNISNTKPPEKMIRDAVFAFRSTLRLRDSRETRFVCWGAATRFGKDEYLLMESEGLFKRLLTSVDNYSSDPKAFRRCFRGLLSSYFGYDPDSADATESGRNNWELLRFFLEKKINMINTPGLSGHDWVNAITEHRNLLSDTPCERYGKGFLSGEQADLDISASTWVSRAIFNARFSAAVSCDDEEFVSYLPRLMKMLEDRRYARFMDKGLSMLLDRYSGGRQMPVHHELRDFIAKHWKSPWSLAGTNKWSLVSGQAYSMVVKWMRLDLVKRFFEYFSGDGFNSSRRSDFWGLYIDRISEIYFALGRDAMGDRRPDFMSVKKRMEGRLLAIDDGLSILHNNAMLMRIGDFWFIEFGGVGGAVYVYEELPFDPAEMGSINVSMLKDRQLSKDRLYHRDNSHGFSRWEDLFKFHIGTFFKISQDPG